MPTPTHITEREAVSSLYRLLEHLDIDSPGFPEVSTAARVIRNAAIRLDQLNTMECNGIPQQDGYMGLTEADQERLGEYRKRAESRTLDALRRTLGNNLQKLTIEFNGDPRGPAIVLHSAGTQDCLAIFW